MAKITVCSKLPFDFRAEHGGKTVLFSGARVVDPTDGRHVLSGGYGMTPDVDGDWFEAWKDAAKDFPPVQNGVIFAAAPNKAADESAEMAQVAKSGFEQKSPDDLGVEVTPRDD